MGRYNSWDVFDKFRSRDVLVIGNGPSLNKTELKRINMVSIGMNKINLLFDRTDWRPDIITCVNGLVIRQNKEFFNKTDVILVLPVRALYLGVKKRKNVIFLKPINSSEFSADITNGFAFCGSTVTYSVLQIAAYLNPESINIVGVDHYFKNYSGKSAVEKYEGDDSNHFDPRYFKDLLWGLPDLEGSERAYSIAKRYFDSKNIAITDYTIGGKLKIFNKGNIDNIYDKYPI
jgi:hypothetical protein